MAKHKQSAQLYAGSKAFDWNKIDIIGGTEILVDDGAATGATIIATSRYIKANKSPSRIIVSIPIVPKGTVDLFKTQGILNIEVITSPPDDRFRLVEQFYQNFSQDTDDEVKKIVFYQRK